MKKIGLETLFIGLAIFALVFLLRDGKTAGEERCAYWEQKLSNEVPPETSRERLLEWAKDNSVLFADTDDQHMSAIVEKVSGGWLAKLSCSGWNVVVDIELDPFYHISTEKVHMVSACL